MSLGTQLVFHVGTEQDVIDLAERIRNPQRSRPIVVVSGGPRKPGDRLDGSRIARVLGSRVEVAVLDSSSWASALAGRLPDECGVFGDAARTYPMGDAWQRNPALAPMRLCRVRTDVRRVEDSIIADAQGARLTSTPAAARLPADRPITPATLPGAPPARVGRAAPDHALPLTATPKRPPHASGDAPVSGPTPTNPRGEPPIPASAVGTRRPNEGSSTKPTPAPTPQSVDPMPGGRLPNEQPWHARDEGDGRALAEHLRSAARTHPVLVVTTPRDEPTPTLDGDGLHLRLNRIADVVVLHDGPASWAFSDAMPNMTQVYGGAGRVYPVDLRWLTKPSRAPLRFCWKTDDPARVADVLEDDAYAAAHTAGLLVTQSPSATLPAIGKVQGFAGRHHALLWLDRGGNSLLLIDELVPDSAPARVLAVGQTLRGRVERNAAIPRFVLDPVQDDRPARVRKAYRSGDVVLARLVAVGRTAATGQLLPGVGVQIRAAEDESDLRNLIAADEVCVVTLVDEHEGQWDAVISADDAPSVAAVPVLPGGPPWLLAEDLPTPATTLVEDAGTPTSDPASEDEPSAEVAPAPLHYGRGLPAPTPSTLALHNRILALQAQADDLAARLGDAEREVARQAAAAGRAREEANRWRRQAKSLRVEHEAFRDRNSGSGLFSDPEDQLRHEVGQAWLRRTPEADRVRWPLAQYAFGPDFLESVAAVEGISRDKVVDVLVEVLTDRAKDIAGRELHPLRSSIGGDQMKREDGARAWRCALQVNAASARRLHYWRLVDNSIELDRVGVHDADI